MPVSLDSLGTCSLDALGTCSLDSRNLSYSEIIDEDNKATFMMYGTIHCAIIRKRTQTGLHSRLHIAGQMLLVNAKQNASLIMKTIINFELAGQEFSRSVFVSQTTNRPFIIGRLFRSMHQ